MFSFLISISYETYYSHFSFFQLLGHLLWVAKKVAVDQGLGQSGYRLGNVLQHILVELN